MKVKLRVPATSANLGPGFDTLGVALSLYNRFEFDTDCEGVAVSGCAPEFAGEDNLAVRAWRAVEALAGARPSGLRLQIDARVPVARGLGSSATLLAAGAAAANIALGRPLDDSALLTLIAGMEGHPDNVAPALLGGLRASILRDGRALSVEYPVHPSLGFCALVPDSEVSTAQARRALPPSVPLRDAARTLSSLALLLRALETGDAALLPWALDDRLHQPWRRKLIPDYDLAEASAKELGGALCISGSGSTLLCILPAAEVPSFAAAMQQRLSGSPHGWRALPLQADLSGTTEES